MKLALVISALDRATRPLQRIGRQVSEVGRKAQAMGQSLGSFGRRASTGLTLPLAAFGGFAVNAFGQIEQMEVAFGSMTGSAQKGREVVAGLIDFAARTPFQLPGLGGATRQLLAAGVSTEDLWEELKILGDISAGAQKPMGEMAAIYAKVMSKGKADTEALNQLSEAGIPIIQSLVDLAADYGNEITKEDVYKAAERGEISFRTLREALEKLTSEGGVFNEQMEKQSQTLFGLASTLKDNVFLGLASVGEKLVEITGLKDRLREFTERVQQAVEWFDKFAEERPGLVKLVFGLSAAAAVLGPALIALGLVVGGVGTGLTALGAALGVLFSPVVLLGAAFAAAAWLIHDNWDGIVAFFEGVWTGIKGAFPGTAAFFEGLWDKAALPVAGIFDWVTNAWDAAVAWISGPKEGESWNAWLMVPVDGLFSWVTDAWDKAVSLIRTPRGDIWDGIKFAGSAAAAAASAFYLDAWSAFQALDWTVIGDGLGALVVQGIAKLTNLAGSIAATADGIDFTSIGQKIGDWMGSAVVTGVASLAGLVANMTATANALDLAGIGTTIGELMGSSLVAAVGALTGIVSSLTATVDGIDFSIVGEKVGGWIGDSVVGRVAALGGLVSGMLAKVQTLDFAGIGQTMGELMGSSAVAAVSALTGIVAKLTDTVGTTDFRGVGDAIGRWMSLGLVATVSMLTGLYTGLLTKVREIDFSEVGRVAGRAVWAAMKAAITALTGLFTGVTAAVKAIDWGSTGTLIGQLIQTAIVGAITLLGGLVDALTKAAADGSLIGAAGGLGQAIWDGIKAVLEGFTDFMVGLITGVFKDIDWFGFLPEWAQKWLEGGEDEAQAALAVAGARSRPEQPLMPVQEMPVYAPPGAAAEGSLYGSGAGGKHGFAPAERGEIDVNVRFDNVPPGASVSTKRKRGFANVSTDVGYAMGDS